MTLFVVVDDEYDGGELVQVDTSGSSEQDAMKYSARRRIIHVTHSTDLRTTQDCAVYKVTELPVHVHVQGKSYFMSKKLQFNNTCQ